MATDVVQQTEPSAAILNYSPAKLPLLPAASTELMTDTQVYSISALETIRPGCWCCALLMHADAVGLAATVMWSGSESCQQASSGISSKDLQDVVHSFPCSGEPSPVKLLWHNQPQPLPRATYCCSPRWWHGFST